MGFFDGPLFDFNKDGKEDAMETFVGLQIMATSRKEAIDLTGDDSFYMGTDIIEDEDDEEFDSEDSIDSWSENDIDDCGDVVD